MIDVRTDLIQKEFEKGCTQGLTFRRLKPSNRFIDWLFRHYYVHEHTEHFYDSEPDFDDEEFNMYLDYEFIHKRIPASSGTAFFNTVLHMDDIVEQKENFRYSKEEHNIKELEAAHKKILKQYEEYKFINKILFNYVCYDSDFLRIFFCLLPFLPYEKRWYDTCTSCSS